ncbi:[cytidine(C)-cytidine(C)-adenosine (A)]-adding enzyme [Cohnella ginsengisoli]|uniref:[cytidine(C)-cytidine(C)-adenosine (A)]-adding enzyme n=1 Tax=Cohnella ginsengisoli TaxID=425004 RepID=A0A9X4KD42_9BACL|nr:[cytidine(C)-cytidine(C)-adenosine (A)]-adding enzyme [Cohnella ginsengisoli]MDG0789640.1 [cytidine(C)-cytidine(C)-adenosine (A)]-adding enzyme [Cohnella ginsengisoli]
MIYAGAQWEAGVEVLQALNRSGCEAYFVGGCVRDALLGIEASDIDIATSADPEEVLRLYPDALPTGLKHGTVTVRRSGFFFEVTTFRQEAGYSDGRRPDDVFFVRDVREDLARRDFTINAMAAGADGAIVDPFGGMDDLRARTLRAVGEPARRFGEDALRIVRCVRFAARYGFAVDAPTWAGVLACRDKLRLVAMERIGAELDKMMAAGDPGRAVALLLAASLPERFKLPLPEPWLARLRQIEGAAGGADEAPIGMSATLRKGLSRYLPEHAEADLRWAALFLAGTAAPEEAEEAMKRLHFAGKRIRRIGDLLRLHLSLFKDSDPEAWRRNWTIGVLDRGTAAAADWQALFDSPGVRAAFGVPGELRAAAAGWTAALPAVRVADLALRGDELAEAAGSPPGPWIAIALRGLLEQVALGELNNDANSLRTAFFAGA